MAVKIDQLRIVDGALFPGSLRPGDTEPAAKSAAGWHGTLSDGLFILYKKSFDDVVTLLVFW